MEFVSAVKILEIDGSAMCCLTMQYATSHTIRTAVAKWAERKFPKLPDRGSNPDNTTNFIPDLLPWLYMATHNKFR